MVFGDVAVTVVLATVYLVPALCAAWFHAFFFSYYAIWLAALAGAMLPRGVRAGWMLPGRWKAPLELWALALALSWPLVVLREIDFIPALLDKGDLWNSRLSTSPPLVTVWVLSVAAIVMTGLLLLDWTFDAFPARQESSFERRVIWPVFGAAVAASAVAAYQMLVDITFLNGTAFAALGRAVGTMRDANPFGVVVALWVPIAAALAISAGVRSSVAGWFMLVLLVIAVWASGSRTALLCTLAGLAVFMISLNRALIRRRMVVGAAGAALSVLVLISIAPTATTGPVKRIHQFFPQYSGSEIAFSLRQLWERDMYGPIAHRMIAEHPLVGVGVGGFNYLYADVLYLIDRSERPPDNSQNWYRQQLAELGLLGSAGWIGFVALFGWLLARTRMPEERRPIAAAVKGSVIGLALASLLGMPTQDTAASITFVILAAWCLRLSGAGTDSTHHARLWPARYESLFIIVVMACFLGGTFYEARHNLRPAVRAERAEFPYRYGFQTADEGDPAFRWTAKRAVDVFPIQNRYVRVVIGAVAPDAAEHPVEVKVWRGDELVISLTRRSNFPVERWIRLSDHDKFARLEIEVSRTWRANAGAPDSQPRGAAVQNWEFAYWTPKGAVVVE